MHKFGINKPFLSCISQTTGLFVVVSWISFVVPPDVIPGRMGLLITLFLVLVNIFNSVTTNTPKAEGKYTYYIHKQNLYSEMEITVFELNIHVVGMFVRRHWLYLLFLREAVIF